MLLKTKRLYLRNLVAEDAGQIYAYRNDPDCGKFQRWEKTDLDSVHGYIDRFRGCSFLSQEEEQHYALCLSDGTMAGELSYFYTEQDRCITLGITVAPRYQRKGIAREILGAVIAAVQERHPRLDIVALIDPENERSIRLFESLGFYRECYAESICSYVYVIDGTPDAVTNRAGSPMV